MKTKLKTAICVTTYKHRHNDLLRHLSNFPKDYDIYIITQHNDPELDKYPQYCVSDNIKLLETDATSAMTKRECVRNELLKLGYQAILSLDDDLKITCKTVSDGNKRATSNSYKPTTVDIALLVDEVIRQAEQYNATIATPGTMTYLGFEKPGHTTINSSLATGGVFMYINLENLEKHKIHYHTEGYVHSDVDLIVKCLTNGLTCITLKDWGIETVNGLGNSKSTIYKDKTDYYKLELHGYIKWGFPLKIGTKDSMHFWQSIPTKKLWNNPDLLNEPRDPELLALCEADDVEGVANYLKAKQIEKIKLKENKNEKAYSDR